MQATRHIEAPSAERPQKSSRISISKLAAAIAKSAAKWARKHQWVQEIQVAPPGGENRFFLVLIHADSGIDAESHGECHELAFGLWDEVDFPVRACVTELEIPPSKLLTFSYKRAS